MSEKFRSKQAHAGNGSGRLARLTLAALVVVGVASVVSAEDWEPLETRKTADVLPAEILSSDHYRIADAIETDGFLNLYSLQTDYGEFSADSDWELEIRLLEVEAMGELAKVTKSKAFTDSLGDAAMAPVDATVDLVTHPIGTTKAAAKGVANLFKRSKRVAKKITAKKEEPPEGSEGEEGKEKEPTDKKELAKKVLGTDKQIRLWSYKLRIDPYSDNQVLIAELGRVATASAMGGSSLKLRTFDSIEGGLPNVSKDLYMLELEDLRARNEKILTDAGLTAETFEAFELFFGSSHLSPTMRTIILDNFVRLEGVEGREDLIEMAAAMETADEARFQVGHAEFLAAFHEHTMKLKAIQGGPTIPAALTQDGKAILVIAADHLIWTEELASGLRARLDHLQAATSDEMIDLYVAGDATARATQGLAAMGLRVQSSEF